MRYSATEIEWNKNEQCGGSDDVHYGTDKEGKHACLTIHRHGKRYMFRCPTSHYDSFVPYLLSEIMNAVAEYKKEKK